MTACINRCTKICVIFSSNNGYCLEHSIALLLGLLFVENIPILDGHFFMCSLNELMRLSNWVFQSSGRNGTVIYTGPVAHPVAAPSGIITGVVMVHGYHYGNHLQWEQTNQVYFISIGFETWISLSNNSSVACSVVISYRFHIDPNALGASIVTFISIFKLSTNY